MSYISPLQMTYFEKNPKILLYSFFQWVCGIPISSCLCPKTNIGVHSKSRACRTKCMLPGAHIQYRFEMLLQWRPSRPDQWPTMSMSENWLQHNLNHVIHFDSTHADPKNGHFSIDRIPIYINVTCDITSLDIAIHHVTCDKNKCHKLSHMTFRLPLGLDLAQT